MTKVLQVLYSGFLFIKAVESSCDVFGHKYKSGEELYRLQTKSTSDCSGLFCLGTRIVFTSKYPCVTKAKALTKLQTQALTQKKSKHILLKRLAQAIPTPPKQVVCILFGNTYRPMETVRSGLTSYGCYFSLVCNQDGHIATMREPNCPTTILTPTMSPPPVTIIKVG